MAAAQENRGESTTREDTKSGRGKIRPPGETERTPIEEDRKGERIQTQLDSDDSPPAVGGRKSGDALVFALSCIVRCRNTIKTDIYDLPDCMGRDSALS